VICAVQAVDAECELLDEKEKVHELQQQLEALVCYVLLLLLLLLLLSL